MATGRLEADIKSAMGGDPEALDTKPAKGKGKSPAEVVAGLSPKARAALRARAQQILDAIDAYEAENESPEDEEEM